MPVSLPFHRLGVRLMVKELSDNLAETESLLACVRVRASLKVGALLSATAPPHQDGMGRGLRLAEFPSEPEIMLARGQKIH